eukprot:GHVU01195394.1.p1 GENE.GHVU01195394.1~~GHVU01195394.1.p1  ORF type:complete len:115 (+),score=7.43 GHVU01195394.1:251-595(+)
MDIWIAIRPMDIDLFADSETADSTHARMNAGLTTWTQNDDTIDMHTRFDQPSERATPADSLTERATALRQPITHSFTRSRIRSFMYSPQAACGYSGECQGIIDRMGTELDRSAG